MVKTSTLIPIIIIPVFAIIIGLVVIPELFNEEVKVVHPTFAMHEDGIFLNNPSDRFYNFSNHEYPAFKIWWEIKNWNENVEDIAHIEQLELTLSLIAPSIFNQKDTKLTIKGIEVFDNLVIEPQSSQTTSLDEIEDIQNLSSRTIYQWKINTDYLIQGDVTFVDWDLEKVVTTPRNHPIILFKMVFDESEESLQKLLEIQTVEAEIEIKIKNYDAEGVFEGWTSTSDRVMFVFYEKEKPDDYRERFWERYR